jgi:KUP system potassium uptake protein
MVGSNMVLSDGVLTPAISVVSAIEGIAFQTGVSATVVTVSSVAILAVLFSAQRFGTARVSAAFAPIMIVWFAALAAVGIFNVVSDPSVFRALSPHYMYYFWSGRSTAAWKQLGSVMLCVTGAEALYADLGHFGRPGITLGFVAVVWPSLTLTYLGQTAVIISNPESSSTVFWSSIPSPVYWPMVVLATLAAIIASQAMISGAFSVASQGMALNLFPRFGVLHTSKTVHGQIYVPAVNWFLFAGSVAVVVGFGSSAKIGEAYGLAVVCVMFATDQLVAIVQTVCWDRNPAFVGLFWLTFSTITGAFLSSTALKVPTGAWFPLVVSAVLTFVTYAWYRGKRAKAASLANASCDIFAGANPIVRVPGIGVHYTETNGAPPSLKAFLDRVPALHETVVFITNRRVPAPSVSDHERFVVRRLPADGFYHVLARYGYTDRPEQGDEFFEAVFDEIRAYVDVAPGGDVEAPSSGSSASELWVQQPSARRAEGAASLPLPAAVRESISGFFTVQIDAPTRRAPIPSFFANQKSAERSAFDASAERGASVFFGRIRTKAVGEWGVCSALTDTYATLEGVTETFASAYGVTGGNVVETNFSKMP